MFLEGLDETIGDGCLEGAHERLGSLRAAVLALGGDQ